MSGVKVWPKPPKPYSHRLRHRYVVQYARSGNSPWSDANSSRWKWLAILHAWLLGFTERTQVIDQGRRSSDSGSES